MKKADEAMPNMLLKTARESLGWTQEEVAEKLGAASVSISRWESGTTFPSRFFRKRLSGLYGKSLQDLGLMHRHGDRKECRPTDISRGSIFLFNEPLTTANEFYGRQCERNILIQRTCRGASTAIVGPHRIGKTWLLDYLFLVSPQHPGNLFRIGYLDATRPSCQSVDGFVAAALTTLGLPLSGERGLLGLEKGLQDLSLRKYLPVLCIDEFDALSDRTVFTSEFFRGLRAMTRSFDLVLVIASSRPLRDVLGEEREGSGFIPIFEQIFLEPFSFVEAEEFVKLKGAQADFSPQELGLLWRYGALPDQRWSPLRLQLVGKMLLEQRCCTQHDADHWQRFERRLEMIYREVTG